MDDLLTPILDMPVDALRDDFTALMAGVVAQYGDDKQEDTNTTKEGNQ